MIWFHGGLDTFRNIWLNLLIIYIEGVWRRSGCGTNTLVQAFAETGIPGGIFFVLCTIFPLWEGFKFFVKNRDKMDVSSVILYKYLIISLAGFWVCAFFSNRVYFKILYVLIALIVAVRGNILKPQGLINEKG